MRRSRALLGALLGLSWSIQVLCPSSAIAGTRRHDVPEQAYLDLASQAAYDCVAMLTGTSSGGPVLANGVLVASHWVLTHPNAVNAAGLADLAVDVGSNHRSVAAVVNNGSTYQAGKLTLLRLSEPVLGVQPARVYRGTFAAYGAVTIVGFGQGGTGLTGAQPGTSGVRRAGQNSLDGSVIDFDDPENIDGYNPTGYSAPLSLEYLPAPGDTGAPFFADTAAGPALLGVVAGPGLQFYGDRFYNASYSDSVDVSTWLSQNWLLETIAHTWTGSDGGLFGDGANWQHGMVPPAGETAQFVGDAATTCVFGADASTGGLLVRQPGLTLDLGGHTYSQTSPGPDTSVIVGNNAGETAGLVISSGTLASRSATLGNSGSTGQVTVRSGARWSVAENLKINPEAGWVNVEPGGQLDVVGGLAGGGSLIIDGTASVGQLGTIRSVLGSGRLTLTGDSTWGSSTMTGTGTTEVAASAVLRVTNTAGQVFKARTIENSGLIRLGDASAFNFEAGDGARVQNQAGGTVDLVSDVNLFVRSDSTAPPVLRNEGLLRKSGGTGVSSIKWRFDNAGTVEALSGTLSLEGGGTLGGQFSVSPGAKLRLSGSYDATNPAGLPRSGVEASSGFLRILGDHEISDWVLAWGSLSGTGTTTVLAGGTLDARRGKLYRPVTNHGTILTSLTDVSQTLINEADGTIKLAGNLGSNPNPGVTVFNRGLLQAESGVLSTSFVSTFLHNTGVLDVASGRLSLQAGGELDGQFRLAPGATLSLSGGTYNAPHPEALPRTLTVGNSTLTLHGDSSFDALVVTRGSTFSTLLGSGRTTLVPGGVFNVSAIVGRTLVNQGTLELGSDTSITEAGAVINEAGGRLVIAEPASSIMGGSGRLDNTGLVEKSGSGSRSITPALNNSGTVRVLQGELGLRGGGRSNGHFEIAEGARLSLGGDQDLTGATFSGLGQLTLGGADYSTATFNEGVVWERPIRMSTTVQGAGAFTLGQGASTASGGMAGSGVTTVLSGASLEISSFSLNRVLRNQGTISAGHLRIGASGLLINEPAGYLQFREIGPHGIVSGRIENQGTMKTGTPRDTTTVTVPLHNSGIVQVVDGARLDLLGGSSGSGGYEVLSGQLKFGGTHDLTGATISTAGNVELLPGASVTGPSMVGTGALLTWRDSSLDARHIRVRIARMYYSGRIRLMAGGGEQGTSRVTVLTFDDNYEGKVFDVTDHDLILADETLDAVTAHVRQGYNGGGWSGWGITSSAAALDPNAALGILQNNDGAGVPLFTTFSGLPAELDDILVKYTVFGDSDLSGGINTIDYDRLDHGLEGSLLGWANGDFNYDGVINFLDYALIDAVSIRQRQNWASGMYDQHLLQFGAPYDEALSALGIPEPATAVTLGLVAAITVLGRRRRPRQA